MTDLYIGLISGTSMDGIDAALVRFGKQSLNILQTHAHPYPASLRRQLMAARTDQTLREADDIVDLHRQVGACFRDAAKELLSLAGTDAGEVAAIGSHGQTIRHEPDAPDPYSLQIGDADLIASGSGITTFADFRSADIALGGQGAPLAPAFHDWLFRKDGTTRTILNIGGIANITVLPGDGRDCTGFDTGPGNTLLDAWNETHNHSAFDRDGAWGAGGNADEELLTTLMADPFFAAAAPKSTGFEYFNLDWLRAAAIEALRPVDVQATLCQLTANSIADAIQSAAPETTELLVCGGGVHNQDLMRRLGQALPDVAIAGTTAACLDPDWVEAAAFAWLAMRTMRGLPGNLPAVTGASAEAVLGVRFDPS